MADEENNAEEVLADEEKTGTGGAKKWIIIGVILMVVLALEAGIAVMVVQNFIPQDPNAVAEEERLVQEDSLNREKTWMGKTLENPISVVVNIGDKGDRYLKTGLQFEFNAEKFPLLEPEIIARMPKIKDLIIGILAGKSMIDLTSAKGKKAVRTAIVADVNRMIPAELGKIRSCYFDEFIIQ